MKNEVYSPFRDALDKNSDIVMRELPKRFSTNLYAEKVHRLLPNEYAEAMKRLSEFGLKDWLSRYYLPRKTYVRRVNSRLRIVSKSKFNREWLKLK